MKNLSKLKSTIPIQSSASITDYAYNNNGTKLAVTNSQGFVYIYKRNKQNFIKTSQFQADEASIWKVCWSSPYFGNIIGLCSFKKRVSIYFLKNNNVWIEIAFHEIHDSSVNWIQWASYQYGLKLFAAGSDGIISILSACKNNWNITSFQATQCPIYCLALKPTPLNENQSHSQHLNPMIVTVSKDMNLKIWKQNVNEQQQITGGMFSEQKQEIYTEVCCFKPHKDLIRQVIWRPIWSQSDSYQLITCCQDGSIKIIEFINNKMNTIQILLQFNQPICRISQSITGNIICISLQTHAGQQHHMYSQNQKNKWQEQVLLN